MVTWIQWRILGQGWAFLKIWDWCGFYSAPQIASDQQPQVITDPSIARIPAKRGVFFGVRSPFDRDRRFRVFRSLTDGPVELHLNDTTDRMIRVLKNLRSWLRNSQSTVGGPKWTQMVHFGLTNAKIQFRIRSFWPKQLFGPFWTILVQYPFQQYRGHSLMIAIASSAARSCALRCGFGWLGSQEGLLGQILMGSVYMGSLQICMTSLSCMILVL